MKSEESPRNTRQRAVQHLYQIRDVIDSIESPEWKIRLRAHVASLLWDDDGPEARAMFEASFRSVNPDDADVAEKSNIPGVASHPPIWPRLLRNEIVSLAAAKDPKFAQSLIASLARTLPPDDDAAASNRIEKRQNSLYAQVAASLVESKPDLAGQWLDKGLGSGPSFWWIQTLLAIQKKDSALADQVFRRALAQIREQPAMNLRGLLAFSIYLFPENLVGGLFNTVPEEDGVEVAFDVSALRSLTSSIQASPALVSEYLDLAYERCRDKLALLANSVAPLQQSGLPDEAVFADVIAAASLRPLLSKYAPEKLAALQVPLDAIGKQLNFESGLSWEKVLQFLGGGEEGVIAALSEKQPGFHLEAASLAVRRGDTEKAQALLEQTKDEGTRENIRLMLATHRISKAVEQGELETAYGELKTLESNSDKARFLVQMAQKLCEQKDNERGLQWFVEAADLAAKSEDSSYGLTLMADIAEKVMQLNPEKGHQLAVIFVDGLNKLTAYSGKAREDGSSSRVPFAFSDVNLAHSLLQGQAFSLLARHDFEAALTLAQSIIREEPSLAAQLAVYRGILSSSSRGASAVKQ